MIKNLDYVFNRKLLKYHRKQLKATQSELADELSVATSTVKSLENGKYQPSSNLLMKIVSLLDLGYWMISTQEPTCWKCGCTQNHACSGGCYWVETDLCSACVEEDQS